MVKIFPVKTETECDIVPIQVCRPDSTYPSSQLHS